VIDTLVRGLIGRGHDVTLFAHAESEIPCQLEPYENNNNHHSKGALLSNLRLVSSKINKGNFDVVHSFGRLAYLLPVLPSSVPKLMSYQREITPRSVLWGERFSRGTLHFAGCSRRLIEAFAGKSNWHVVYNGVPVSTYSFRSEVKGDAPLVFLGRVEEIKGPHLAIEVAQRSGRRLIIAGNVPQGPAHQEFFETKIAPQLDGNDVTYIGPVNDAQKDDLLGNAAAMLMPILWEEPFGIVMAEALACGTPVIGLRRGSVPEVIDHEVTGFVCDSVDEMVNSVSILTRIDRNHCRKAMEERFSDCAMIDAYERIYRTLCN
jgi:glycosyltransferase involved in cell wall biosynthesis